MSAHLAAAGREVGIERFVARLWDLGFDAVREIASYMAMGAVVVVPIWLLMRIFGGRSAR